VGKMFLVGGVFSLHLGGGEGKFFFGGGGGTECMQLQTFSLRFKNTV